VLIHVWKDKAFVRLLFYDNGKGFDMNQQRSGIGLSNISTRVSSMDGEMEIISAPGDGCELRIAIPVNTHDRNS
jgi:two-component system sensor histidine kinase UhpB